MNNLNLRFLAFLILFSLYTAESFGGIINGDFATGDLTGWTVSAIDQAAQPTTPLINVGLSNGTFFADFPTGEFVDDVFISTLEQTFTVTPQETFLSFEFSLPSIIPDNTGTGSSPFFDVFAVSLLSIASGDFFDLLLVDQFSVLADPFGTAPGTVTLGAPSDPLFDFVLNADLGSLAGESVTLFLDVINEDDGFQFNSPYVSKFDITVTPKGSVPEPGALILLIIGFIASKAKDWNLSRSLQHIFSTAPYRLKLHGASHMMILLVGAIFLWSPTIKAADIDRNDLINVDAQTSTNFSGIFHNRRSGLSTFNLSITNTSPNGIATPLIVVIESTSNASVSLLNGDGMTTPDGRPLLDYSGQITGDTLDSAETTATRPLRFNNPSRRPFTLQVSVYQQSITPLTPQVTIEVPSDSQGRKLVGIPDGIIVKVRAQGTSPVTVSLGQQAAASGSRGEVFFGATGSNNTLSVTTSGGADNSVNVPVRGVAERPSAFHGDLKLTASVGGILASEETISVLALNFDQPLTSLFRDMTFIRTATVTPATEGLAIVFDHFRIAPEQPHALDVARTNLSVIATPLNGASTISTDANGIAQFQTQAGVGGQGSVWGFGEAVGSSNGSRDDIDNELTDKKKKECNCKKKGNSVDPSSGEKYLSLVDLNIPGRGFNYSFSRTYRSQVSNLRSAATNDFGVDWTFSYSDDRLFPDGNNVVVFRPALYTDVFIATNTPGAFISPIEFYESLRMNADDDFELRDENGMVKTYQGFDHPDIPGRLIHMEDRNGNFMSFLYEQAPGLSKFVLTTVVDTMGRNIVYRYYPNSELNVGRRGRLMEIEDFRRDNSPTGRKLKFDYDAEGNLILATSPTVTGTPHGNDFPVGKTMRYTYTLAADIPVTINGTDRARLLHNLTGIEYPNETAVDLDAGNAQTLPTTPNTQRETVTYGTDPSDPDTFDRALSYTIGETTQQHANGVLAGGTIQYVWEIVSPVSPTTNDPFLKATVIDRRGNVTEYVHSAWGTMLSRNEFTRGFRTVEPDNFLTEYQYNDDKELLETALPEGNTSASLFDQNNADRFQQGNVLRSERLPDIRGGDQTGLFTEIIYEPIYQRTAAMTDSRGLDQTFTPPITDSCGRSQRERYTTHNFFDYQEAAVGIILPLLAEELGTDQATVQNRLNAAGIQLGLGDLNGDGIITMIAGNIVRQVKPNVVLLSGANQAVIKGDTCQEIITQFQFNALGQMTARIDPEDNIHSNQFFAETDPDGDGTPSPPPADGRVLNNSTGGYLASRIKDAQHLASANNGNTQPPTIIRTHFTFDDVGNQTSILDGRRILTEFKVNELNQVVQTKRAADVSEIGNAAPSEPLSLMAFAYIENTFYDFNDNVVKREVEDRGNTSNTGGFVDFTFSYDILDNVIKATQEVDINETLTTQYRYDANENRTLTVLPEQNCATAEFDERDLQFQGTRGALVPTTGTLSVPTGDCDPRSGVPSTITFNYDKNQNLTEQVDADDTDNSTANNSTIAGIGDSTMFLFDGFDRRVTTIDAVGNRTNVMYDPVSNVVRQSAFGPIGGASPQNKNGANNVLLSQLDYVYDELRRKFQEDHLLFVSTGVSTQRPANISDSDLTPGDDRVTMRYEYDRKSRQTFKIQDDEDTYRSDYDGADRVIKETDPEGNLREYAYDDNNNVIESRETDVAQIANIDNEVFLTTYFYDSLDRLQRQIDNIGQTHYFRYDSRNNQVAMADAEGPTFIAFGVRRSFEISNVEINGFGNITVYQYDGINRRIREDRVLTTDAQGDGTNIGATLEGVKTATPPTDPSQSGDGLITVRYDFDKNSLLTSFTDDNGNQTRFGFDNLNRQITETKGIVVAPALADRDDPDTAITTEFDRDDNVVKLTDENGSMRNCRFDAINRRIDCDIDRAANAIGTTEESYQYDGLSRLTLATDNNSPGEGEDNSLITYAYDSLSRVIEECQQIGSLPAKCISSGWLAENLRIALTYPNDRMLEYGFDGLDRLADIRDQGAASDTIVEYDYIGVSRVLERRYPINGTRMTYLDDSRLNDDGYDGLRRPVQLRHLRADHSLVVGFEHGYDRMNNKLFENKLHDPGNGDPGNSELYDYDSVYRVVDFQRGTLNATMDGISSPTLTMDTTTGEGAIQQQSWMLDGLGNWDMQEITKKSVLEPETRLDTSFNEYFVIDPNKVDPPPPVERSHDDNGNLIDDGTLLYAWDYRNRLRTVARKSDNAPISGYIYDATNRRVRKFVEDGAETTDFYYGGWRVLEERNGTDDLVQQYIYGVYIDEVLVMDRNLDGGVSALDAGDKRLFYHQNPLYSVFGLTDVAGVIVEGYLYDAYGGQTVYEGGLNGVVEFGGDDVVISGGVSTLGNFYMFTGRRLDPETGLYYYRARYMDTVKGRFLSRDPAGYLAGANLYAAYFVPNSADPLGLSEFDVVSGLGDDLSDGWISDLPAATQSTAKLILAALKEVLNVATITVDIEHDNTVVCTGETSKCCCDFRPPPTVNQSFGKKLGVTYFKTGIEVGNKLDISVVNSEYGNCPGKCKPDCVIVKLMLSVSVNIAGLVLEEQPIWKQRYKLICPDSTTKVKKGDTCAGGGAGAPNGQGPVKQGSRGRSNEPNNLPPEFRGHSPDWFWRLERDGWWHLYKPS